MNSLRQQLLLWLLGGVLLSTAAAGAGMYWLAHGEADDLFDYQIRQIALSLPEHILPPETVNYDDDVGENVELQVWDANGSLLFASFPTRILPRYDQPGFATVSYKHHDWRIFVTQRHNRHIQVAQPMQERRELAAGLATRSLWPFAALIPVLAALIWLVVGRSLRPLQNITHALEQRDADAMHPLSLAKLPKEILPLVDAINRLLSRLDRSLQQQRDFIADAAHELRSPLTALSLQMQLVERAGTAAQRAASFAKLKLRLERTIHLVKQLLTLARSEPQAEAQNFAAINLTELVQQVVGDYSALAQSHRLILQWHPPPEIMVRGQSENLCILISNLIDNAIRYTPEHGLVQVQLTAQPDSVVLSVTDTGAGIPAEERTRVFDRFYRREVGQVSGSGLGLAIVRNIAQAHRADISLADNPSGQGLAASVCFARCTQPDA